MIHHFTSSFRWSLYYIDHYTMLIYANLFIHQKKTTRKALSIFGGSSREYFRASGKALGGTVAVRTFQYGGLNLWSTSENYTVYQFIPSIVFWQQETVAFKQCPQNKDNNNRKVFKTKQIKQQNISDMCSPWVFKGCLQPFSTGLQCWKSRIRSASRRRHYQSLDLQERRWLLWKITEFQPISSNQKSNEITLQVCSWWWSSVLLGSSMLVDSLSNFTWLQVKTAINWKRITFWSCIFPHPYGSTFILTQIFRTSNLRNKNKTNPRCNPQVVVLSRWSYQPELSHDVTSIFLQPIPI